MSCTIRRELLCNPPEASRHGSGARLESILILVLLNRAQELSIRGGSSVDRTSAQRVAKLQGSKRPLKRTGRILAKPMLTYIQVYG